MKRFSLAVRIILLIFLAWELSGRLEAQTVYTIGGPAGPTNYATLAALFTSPAFFQNGDVIILYNDDNSLQGRTVNLNGATVTIRSNDPSTPRVISMNNPASPPINGGMMQINGGGTLVLGNVEFSDGRVSGNSSGGAIYADSSLSFTDNGNYKFSENTATSSGGAIFSNNALAFSGGGNYLFTGNQALADRGGAIYANSSLGFSGDGEYTFTGNKAMSGGAIGGGGGTPLTFTGNGNYTFSNNYAIDLLDRGLIDSQMVGGAIRSDGSITFSGNGNYLFTNNESGGYGGAIWGNTIIFSGNGDYRFTKNKTITSGGVIYANDPGAVLKFSGSGNYLFEENEATGLYGRGGAIGTRVQLLEFSGDGNYTFTGNKAVYGGGAIFASSTTINFSGTGTYLFQANEVTGDNNSSGRGGAIYAMGDLAINTGATFTNNHATTLVTGDMTKGLGGAIYYSGSNLTINALDTPNGAVLFQGNTMNPGNTGTIPNSIYFGNPAFSGDHTTTAAFDMAANAKFWMLDPMASQQDGLQDLVGNTYGNLALDINKTGAGTWVLAGYNDMQSATNWTISEGKLFLVYNDYSNVSSSIMPLSGGIMPLSGGIIPMGGTVYTPTTINLANATNGSFTLASGAGLIVEPGLNNPHYIIGNNITLEAGSTSDVQGFRYGPVLPLGHHVLLTLDETTGTLTNDQAVVQSTDGTVTVGAFTYNYKLLRWERDMHDLVFDVISRTLDPERGGVPAMTGPGEIVVRSRNLAFDAFDQRAKNLFGSCHCLDRITPYDIKTRNNLWATPAYFSTKRSQGERSFDLNTPAVALGYDRQLGDSTFLGIGSTLAWPKYSAGKTDINADDFAIALYGGTKIDRNELTSRIGYGYTKYTQVRGVANDLDMNEYYASRYDGNSFFAGLGWSKLYSLRNPNFCLRPGVNYDFLRIMTNGFHENAGTFALDVDNHAQNLHRVKVGVDVNWQPARWFDTTCGLYYLGLYGNRAAHAGARFINDPLNGFTTMGYPIEQDNLGLSLQLHLPFDRWELGAGYTALVAKNTTSQQATLNAVYRF